MKPGNLFWGLILVFFGGLLLLDNLGLLAGINFSIWAIFWPALLILLGIWVLAGDKLGGAKLESVEIPLEGATQATLRLRHGAGRMSISAGGGSQSLMEGEFHGGVNQHIKRDGERVEIDLEPKASSFFPFTPGMGRGLEWIIRLDRSIALYLDIKGGANENRWELTDLNLKELRIESGASTTQIHLPVRAGYTRVKAESGAASLEFRVPEGVAARIRSSSGLASISIDQGRFPKSPSGYESVGYESAENKVEIELEVGLASVTIS